MKTNLSTVKLNFFFFAELLQDYYCDLSPLQVQLYEDFSKKQSELNQSGSSSSIAQSHIFQVLDSDSMKHKSITRPETRNKNLKTMGELKRKD